MEAEKQEKTDNELIAKFMGFKKNIFEPEFYVLPSTFNNGPFCSCESLLFDTSWDWLMPVVQKIEGLYVNSNHDRNWSISVNALRMPILSSKINDVYKAVVQFIHWHNSQKPLPL